MTSCWSKLTFSKDKHKDADIKMNIFKNKLIIALMKGIDCVESEFQHPQDHRAL